VRPRAVLGQEGRHGLEPGGDQRQPFGERREVTGEQQEQRVTELVEGRRAALPRADDIGVEDLAPEVVHLEVALEAGRLGEPVVAQSLDVREVAPIGLEVAEHGVPRPVPELPAALVQTEIRALDGVRGHDPAEARLDEVVEPVVERSRAGGRIGPAQRRPGVERGQAVLLWEARRQSGGRVQAEAVAGARGGRPAVEAPVAPLEPTSCSASRTASRTWSMSAAVTPWWVTARTV
jgi:hypothetical protein